MRTKRVVSKIVFLLLLLGASVTAYCQSSVAYTSWDSTNRDKGNELTMLIGDQARVVFTIVSNLGTQIHFPSMNEYAQGAIMPLRQWRDSIFLTNGLLLQRQITTVTCFEPGTHVIKDLRAEWSDNKNNIIKVKTSDSLVLHVNYMANVDTSTNEIKDIADVFHEPLTAWEFLRWPLLFIILWIARRETIKYVKKKKSTSETVVEVVEEVSRINPRQEALTELRTLENQHIWQSGNLKEYYTQLTMIVRKYLKKRYQVDSTEMSSDETLDAFSSCKGFTYERNNLLRSVLRSADMVKFAKAVPTAKEHEQSMLYAIAFIEADPGIEEEPAQPSNTEATACSAANGDGYPTTENTSSHKA